MRNICKGVAVVAATMMAMGGAMAGPKPAPHGMAHVGRPGMGMGANPLNLTPAQQQKMQALQMKMMPELQAAMGKGGSQTDMRARMMVIQKKYRPQVMAILTPAQRVKAQAMEARMKAQMKAAGHTPMAH